MNFYEIMMGSITGNQATASFGTEAGQTGSDKSGGISFTQILDSRMNDTSIRAVNLRNTAETSTARQPASEGSVEKSESLYKSYRQVKESIQRTGANERHTVRKASSEDKVKWDEDGKSKKSEETSANVMQILAQLLGVDQEVLNRLLAENGISPETLNSLENTDEATLILSDTLGLDPAQEDTLRTLLEMIKGTIAADSQSEDIPEGIPFDPATQEASEIAGAAGGKTPKTVLDPVIEQLISKISDKLDEFTERLVSEQDTVEDEIEKLLAPLLKKSEAVKQNVIEEGQTTGSDPNEDIKGIDEKSLQESKLQEEDTGEKNDLQGKDNGGEQGLLPKPAQQGDESVQHMFMNTASDSTGTSDVGQIASQRQTVPAREIIGQIVEKAGAVITQDKAEMVMELKPDSLGRISLKVVTENGIVMAKFVAENRQVQQVLETNMQILKDSLERQGINVQSLSVSVRQDGRQQEENRQQYGTTQRIGNRRSMTGAKVVEGVTAGYVEANAVRNPYMWESSTINLTA